MLRVLNIAHLDVDGISSALPIAFAHPGAHVTRRFVATDEAEWDLLKALRERRTPYDLIILSDVSFRVPGETLPEMEDAEKKKRLAKLLNEDLPQAIREYRARGGRLILLDHHKSALKAQAYYAEELDPASIVMTVDEEGAPIAGAEVAFRYYMAVSGGGFTQSFSLGQGPDFARLLADLCRVTSDFDAWRDPSGLGGYMAMATEVMNDPQGVYECFLQALESAREWLTATGSYSWRDAVPPLFGEYMDLAGEKYQAAVDQAWESLVDHGGGVVEIFADFFPSLVAKEIYDDHGGAVIVRYRKDRNKANRVSLRRHPRVALDLDAFARRFGGGGHEASAGIRFDEKAVSIDDIAAALRAELEQKHNV
jgi:oligoribonuclease NrnB/cAMP/cGMP phosphodiesterase (DHH superfamily)